MNTPIAGTIQDAVKVSGLTRTAIYNALKQGHIVARKAGRRTLVDYQSLHEYLAALPTYRRGA